MFEKKFEERLRYWHDFREDLINHEDPIQAAIDFWNRAPVSYRNIDPYDPTTWPDPWEMIEENLYCEYTKILAIAYTLKLSELFEDWQPEFKVGLDKRQSRLYYMLLVQDKVVGFDQEKSVHIKELPEDIHIQKIIRLPKLQ
jgi:hypothetical protein